jgi:putative transposase
MYYKHKLPEKDEGLRLEIEAVMLVHPGYGHRRIAQELGISKERARRVMRKFHLKPARRAKTPEKPLDRGREAEPYPDITSILSPCAPYVVWVSDFTYICYHGIFVYLATILDLFTGEVMGAQVMTSHSAELVLRALVAALLRSGVVPDWFHSDQGSEYISTEVRSLLAGLGVAISLSPKCSPWRNGAQESFFGRFKVEFGDPERFETLDQLVEALYQHVAYFSCYRIKNKLRKSPLEFKNLWLEQHPGYTPKKLGNAGKHLLRQKTAAAFALYAPF